MTNSKKKGRGWNGYRNTGKEPWSFKKGQSAWNKGKSNSLISRKRMSESHKGKKLSVGHKHKISLALKGRRPFNLGKEFRNWKGGVTPEYRKVRNSREYQIWRLAVFKRDNYTCIWCGIRGVTIHADHIKPFAVFPELRFAIDNGRTLCVPCHKTTETFGNKKYAKL